MKKIIVIENPADIGPLFDNCGKNDETIVIATEPDVADALDRMRIAFRPVEYYYDREEILRQGLLNFPLVTTLCDKMDRALQDRYPELKKFDLRPTGDDFYYIKILFDACMIRIHTLASIIRAEQPDQIVCGALNRSKSSDSQPAFTQIPFSSNERLYGLIASAFSGELNIITIPVTDPQDGLKNQDGNYLPVHGLRFRPAARELAKKLISHITNFWFCIKHATKSETATFIVFSLYNRFRPSRKLVMMGYGYDWNWILPILYRYGYRVIHLGGSESPVQNVVPDKPPAIIGELLQQYCRYQGIEFSRIISDRLIPRILFNLQTEVLLVNKCERCLDTIRPAAVLCSIKTCFSEHTFARIARSRGIPVISWQHGDQGLRKNVLMTELSEIKNSDYHYCFGSAVKDQLIADKKTDYSCRHVPIGSCELEGLFLAQKKRHCRNRTIIYALNDYYHNTLYIPSPILIEDNTMWKSHKSIIDAIGKQGGKHIIKIHPASYPDDHIIRYIQERYPHLMIRKKERFISLLRDTNIVIVDFPSTTLLQAIAAGKTVFVLIEDKVLTPQAFTLLRKRAYCFRTAEELVSALRSFLKGDPLSQHPDSENREFLEAYGICQPDGKVKQRAANTLDAIVKGTFQ